MEGHDMYINFQNEIKINRVYILLYRLKFKSSQMLLLVNQIIFFPFHRKLLYLGDLS